MKRHFNLQLITMLLIMAMVSVGCSVKKMVKNYDQVKYEVTPEVLQVDGGKINFTIKGTYPPNYFKKRAIVEMQPVFVFSNGKEKTELKPVVHLGEKQLKKINKQKAENVKYQLKGLDEKYATVAKKEAAENSISYLKGGSFTMTGQLDYVPGMKISELFMMAKVSGKNKVVPMDIESTQVQINGPIDLPDRKVADGLITTGMRIENANDLNDFRWKTNDEGLPVDLSDYSPQMRNVLEANRMMLSNDISNRLSLSDLIMAEHNYEKQTFVTKEAKIYFAKNLYAFNLNLPENKKNNVQGQLDELKQFIGQGWPVKEVVIDGWASPEGEEAFNDGLSENRAKTAKKYLTDEIKKMSKSNPKISYKDPEKELDMKLTAHGPDWNGFLVKVDNSDLKDKKSIMNVIKSSGQDKREEEIRNMILIYPEMEKEILPPLRRSEIMIKCAEPKKSDDEIAKLSTTNPESLDVKELLYSATLTKNLKTQLNIYKSATKIYPNDWRGYNNAAYTDMKMGNVSEASTMLEKAKGIDPVNGIILNNLGVIASLEQNYEKAESYFKKSQELGISQNYNMGVLMIPKGDYQKSLDMMKGKGCDYNVGLANLLSGNTQSAAKNLECAPKTAATYYLLAIVGARTSNTVMMLNNLQKAIDKNPAYKVTAREDREFIKYFGNEEFKKLVE